MAGVKFATNANANWKISKDALMARIGIPIPIDESGVSGKEKRIAPFIQLSLFTLYVTLCIL